jgi:hypothetical protein
MPQIIMLQHAAWVEKKRSDIRVRSKRQAGDMDFHDSVASSVENWNGKPIDQLTSEEYIAYHQSAFLG